MHARVRIAVAAFAALAALSSPFSGLLWLMPALALVALLAFGCYPGERALVARLRPARRRRVRPAATLGSRGRAPHALGPAGAALLAFNRAVRPPPAVSPA